MMSDNEILVFLGTCCIILMLILGKVNGIKKIFSHLILFMSYTLFFVYNLVYKGQYGTSCLVYSFSFSLSHSYFLTNSLFINTIIQKNN